MKRLAAALALLLAGCNQGATVTEGQDGSVTVEKDGKTVSVNAGDCTRARFVPLYADARITTCVAEGKRGTIIYTSAATPGAVLAWYRSEVEKAGLKVSLQTDMNLSASEGNRKLMVMAIDHQVTVNWSE